MIQGWYHTSSTQRSMMQTRNWIYMPIAELPAMQVKYPGMKMPGEVSRLFLLPTFTTRINMIEIDFFQMHQSLIEALRGIALANHRV